MANMSIDLQGTIYDFQRQLFQYGEAKSLSVLLMTAYLLETSFVGTEFEHDYNRLLSAIELKYERLLESEEGGEEE